MNTITQSTALSRPEMTLNDTRRSLRRRSGRYSTERPAEGPAAAPSKAHGGATGALRSISERSSGRVAPLQARVTGERPSQQRLIASGWNREARLGPGPADHDQHSRRVHVRRPARCFAEGQPGLGPPTRLTGLRRRSTGDCQIAWRGLARRGDQDRLSGHDVGIGA
ncbi:MAG: hypothetical protein ACREX3_12350 [Gammaproteobacteria bacterium]